MPFLKIKSVMLFNSVLCNVGVWVHTNFPDWSIPGSESTLKIGYNYGRLVTGEKLHIEPDLDEEAVHTDNNQIVPGPLREKSLVVTWGSFLLISFLAVYWALFTFVVTFFSFCVTSGSTRALAWRSRSCGWRVLNFLANISRWRWIQSCF